MSDAYVVEMSTVEGGPAALGRAGSFTLVSDRPSSRPDARSFAPGFA